METRPIVKDVRARRAVALGAGTLRDRCHVNAHPLDEQGLRSLCRRVSRLLEKIPAVAARSSFYATAGRTGGFTADVAYGKEGSLPGEFTLAVERDQWKLRKLFERHGAIAESTIGWAYADLLILTAELDLLRWQEWLRLRSCVEPGWSAPPL